MKVEIWSDVMCPFCYIGKRKFEHALNSFVHCDQIELIWKSFQLDPNQITDPKLSTIEHLAQKKGWTLAYTEDMTKHVTELARQVGLTYHLDRAVVANSFDAHRLSHLAKKHGVQDALEEKLFLAYFTEGKNTTDHSILIQLGTAVGLDSIEIKQMLESNLFAEEVHRDIDEAMQVGVRGVPFFVFNRKYAVSGAQDSSTFLSALNQAWSEFEKQNLTLVSSTSDSAATCSTDGCD